MRQDRHEPVLGLRRRPRVLLLHRQLALFLLGPLPFGHVGDGCAKTRRTIIPVSRRWTAEKLRDELPPIPRHQPHFADHPMSIGWLLAAVPHVRQKCRPVPFIHIAEKWRADDPAALQSQQRRPGQIDVQNNSIGVQRDVRDRRKIV